MTDSSIDPLTANYDRWSDSDRRSARWLAVVLAGMAAVLLDQLDLVELLKSQPMSAVGGVALVLLGVLGVVGSAYLAQSDSDADLGYLMRRESLALAQVAATKDLIIRYVPVRDIERALVKGSGIETPTDLLAEPMEVEQLRDYLPKLLILRHRLRLVASSPTDRWTVIIDDAVEQLRARSTFDKTRNRLAVSRWVTVAASLVSGAGFAVLLAASAS